MKMLTGFKCPRCKGGLYVGYDSVDPIFASGNNWDGTTITSCGLCHATFYMRGKFFFVPRTPPVATVEEQRELEIAHIEGLLKEGKGSDEKHDR